MEIPTVKKRHGYMELHKHLASEFGQKIIYENESRSFLFMARCNLILLYFTNGNCNKERIVRKKAQR